MKLFLSLILTLSLFGQAPKGNGFGAGGGGGSQGGVTAPGGNNTAIQYQDSSGLFAGNEASLQFIPSTSTPSAPSLATAGTAGVVTYGYRAACHTTTGKSALSAESTIATGHAVLDGTNYIVVTAPTCSTPNATVDIFITTIGGNINNAGWIGNTSSGGTFNHQGKDGDGTDYTSDPDTSLGSYISGSLNLGDSIGMPTAFRRTTSTPGTELTIAGNSTYQGRLNIVSTTGGSAQFTIGRVRGTLANPTVSTNNDVIGQVFMKGYDGTFFTTGVTLYGSVDGTPVNQTALPSRFRIDVANTDGADTTRLDFRASGSLVLNGFLTLSGTSPGISNTCGGETLATGSSSNAGKVTAKTTGACTITLTFATAFTRAPACNATNETTANLIRAVGSTTTVVISGTTVTNDVVSYTCLSY